MSDKASELLEAAKTLLPFLEASTDGLELEPLEYLKRTAGPKKETRAQRLRREADEIEAKDAAIKRFRKAVAAFEPPDGNAALKADIHAAIRAEMSRK